MRVPDLVRVTIVFSHTPPRDATLLFPRTPSIEHSDVIADRLLVREHPSVLVDIPSLNLGPDSIVCRADIEHPYRVFGHLMAQVNLEEALNLLSSAVLFATTMHVLDDLNPRQDDMEAEIVSEAKLKMKDKLSQLLNLRIQNNNSSPSDKDARMDSIVSSTHDEILEKIDLLSKERVLKKQWTSLERQAATTKYSADLDKFKRVFTDYGITHESAFALLFVSQLFAAARIQSLVLGYMACFHEDFQDASEWYECGDWISNLKSSFSALCPWRTEEYGTVRTELLKHWELFKSTGSISPGKKSASVHPKVGKEDVLSVQESPHVPRSSNLGDAGDEQHHQQQHRQQGDEEEEEEEVPTVQEVLHELSKLQERKLSTMPRLPSSSEKKTPSGDSAIQQALLRRKIRPPGRSPNIRAAQSRYAQSASCSSPVVSLPARAGTRNTTANSTSNRPAIVPVLRTAEAVAQRDATTPTLTRASRTSSNRVATKTTPQPTTEQLLSSQEDTEKEIHALENDINDIMSALSRQLHALADTTPRKKTSSPPKDGVVAAPAAVSTKKSADAEAMDDSNSTIRDIWHKWKTDHAADGAESFTEQLDPSMNIHQSLALHRFLASSRVRRVFRKRIHQVLMAASQEDPDQPSGGVLESLKLPLAPKHVIPSGLPQNGETKLFTIENAVEWAREIQDEHDVLLKSHPRIAKCVGLLRDAVLSSHTPDQVSDLRSLISECCSDCGILSPFLHYADAFLEILQEWMGCAGDCTAFNVVHGMQLVQLVPGMWDAHPWIPISREWLRLQQVRSTMLTIMRSARNLIDATVVKEMFRPHEDEYIHGEFAEWISHVSRLFGTATRVEKREMKMTVQDAESAVAEAPVCLHTSYAANRLRSIVGAIANESSPPPSDGKPPGGSGAGGGKGGSDQNRSSKHDPSSGNSTARSHAGSTKSDSTGRPAGSNAPAQGRALDVRSDGLTVASAADSSALTNAAADDRDDESHANHDQLDAPSIAVPLFDGVRRYDPEGPVADSPLSESNALFGLDTLRKRQSVVHPYKKSLETISATLLHCHDVQNWMVLVARKRLLDATL
eukprot:ANDGO_02491.mRNA.1 hypothetical protein